MTKFAKLFEVDGHQVLFYREPDTDSEHDDREMLHQIVNINGLQADVKLQGFTYENSDKAFDMIDEAAAANLLKMVRDLLTGKSP